MSKVNHQKVLKDLQSHQYTQSQIAERCDCSMRSVGRIAKANDLSPGQGIRHQWAFSGSSPELAYIIGLFLTDGTIRYAYKTQEPRNLTFYNTTIEILDHLENCLFHIGLPAKRTTVVQKGVDNEKHNIHIKPGGIIYHTHCYSTLFARWIKQQCFGKSAIPAFLFKADLPDKMAFISAVIDGDGYVQANGGIRIRNTQEWIRQLPTLLDSAGNRHADLRLVEILKSGKKLYGLSIRREDLRALGGHFYHPVKQDRMLNAVSDFSKFSKPKPKTVCPNCGRKNKSKKSELCRECYLKSDKFREHLKRIAPLGGKAGNIARWGNH